ncbi:remorin-like [Cucurbita pepo subsp. pepo]|uniref:remorin-like n=1 Tax=Cucurbita pepo subsp. pepo TaxID=3664 RepID=UPI000C9D87BF|nr:remorin-like [Cucurbita pepo subsp. pepo]
MRGGVENGYDNNGSKHEMAMGFEFQRGNGVNSSFQRRVANAKSTPSKWDDAQKWIFGLPKGGEKGESKIKYRNSNADDLRLIAALPQQDHDYLSGGDKRSEGQEENQGFASAMCSQSEAETKRVECDEPVWRINKPLENCKTVVRSVCVRDMGTEMTPIASQEPSRTATPVRATTPVLQSPMTSGSSTPARPHREMQAIEDGQIGRASTAVVAGNQSSDQAVQMYSMETRAMAWDEAERAKHMARFKREEVRIQAWETSEKRKAESKMRKMEKKAEKLKAGAQEKLADKLAATRRIAEEKRANAEAKLNKKSVRTSERADYIRRTGHLPSSFSFNLPSSFSFHLPSLCCW